VDATIIEEARGTLPLTYIAKKIMAIEERNKIELFAGQKIVSV
jgi:hypothetical protein